MNNLLLINIITLVAFAVLVFLFIIKTPNKETSWAVFYASLWVAVLLAIVNYTCVTLGYWHFVEANTIIKMPYNLFFIWIVFWGVLPTILFKGKFVLLLLLSLLWIDLLFMPELEKMRLLKLNDNWLIGELALLLLVWLPSYLWAKFSLEKKQLKWRALFQVLIMAILLLFIIPFVVNQYMHNTTRLLRYGAVLLQVGFIIAFPALIAVQDLTTIGKGTPFPYDKTARLVQSGVYAYCRNPIQWSFTLLFIPLSIYYQSPILLLGTVVSIFYTIGVSNPQEYIDMEERFATDWITYKKQVPNWRFLWKPKAISPSIIYFKQDCNQCESIKKWFEARDTINLTISYSKEYQQKTLLQVTYEDVYGDTYKSVLAIARALEHINLAWACLAWFMRFPLISHLLQAIVDSLEIDNGLYCEN